MSDCKHNTNEKLMFLSQIVPKGPAHVMHLISAGGLMKKGKKDRKIAQKVRVKSHDKELEMKEHLHALTDKKSDEQKRQDLIYKMEQEDYRTTY